MEDRHSGRFQKILPLETLEALKAPNAHVVCALDEWCRQGRFLQARDVLSRLEPPEGWEWPEWQVVAARIFYRVGEPARSGRFLAGSRRNALAGFSFTGAIYWVGVVVSASGEV